MGIFSKKALAAGFLAFSFCFIALPAIAQDASAGNAAASAAQDNAPAANDETALPIGDAPGTPTAGEDAGSASPLWALVRVILVLALLAAGIWAFMAFLKKSGRVNVADDPYLKSVANLPLGPNKSAQIITVGTRAFLVGVTEREINLISEIEDKELIDAMNLAADRSSSAAVAGFQSVLASFLPGAKNRKPEGESQSETPSVGADVIRRQRERLLNSSGNREGEGQ